MAYKSLFHFIRNAFDEWCEQRKIYSAFGDMLAGKLSDSAPPLAHMVNHLLLEAAKGTYDTIQFSSNTIDSSMPTLRYTKQGKGVDAEKLPIVLNKCLMNTFELLAERSGKFKLTDSQNVCRQTAEFSLLLEGQDIPITITKEEPTLDFIKANNQRLTEALQNMEHPQPDSNNDTQADVKDIMAAFTTRLHINVSSDAVK